MEEQRNDMENTEVKKDRTHVLLFLIYCVFILMAIVVVLRIVYIQLLYKPETVYVERFTTGNRKVVTEPERGAILSYDGKVLAASTPKYQIAMDCTVRKQEFAGIKDRDEGERKEDEWRSKARKLSAGLSAIYKDRSAQEYYELILKNRRDNRKYMRIGGLVDHDVMQEGSAAFR